MISYCKIFWDNYQESASRAESSQVALQFLVSAGTQVDFESEEKNYLAKRDELRQSMNELQELWDTSFEILPDGRRVFGPDYQAVATVLAQTQNSAYLLRQSITIKVNDAGRIRGVYFSPARGITDISAMKGLSELDEFHAVGANLIDFGILANFKKLEWISLDNTDFEDLTILESLSELKHLSISSTNVKDPTPLLKLPKLRFVNLIDTPIVDVRSEARSQVIQELYRRHVQVQLYTGP